MAVNMHAGWFLAAKELAEQIDTLKKEAGDKGEVLSDKPEVKALKKISKPADASVEDVAAAINQIIAALKA